MAIEGNAVLLSGQCRRPSAFFLCSRCLFIEHHHLIQNGLSHNSISMVISIMVFFLPSLLLSPGRDLQYIIKRAPNPKRMKKQRQLQHCKSFFIPPLGHKMQLQSNLSVMHILFSQYFACASSLLPIDPTALQKFKFMPVGSLRQTAMRTRFYDYCCTRTHKKGAILETVFPV